MAPAQLQLAAAPAAPSSSLPLPWRRLSTTSRSGTPHVLQLAAQGNVRCSSGRPLLSTADAGAGSRPRRRPARTRRLARARVWRMAALVNLALEPVHKVRIVRGGAVPGLMEVLWSGRPTPSSLTGRRRSLLLPPPRRLDGGGSGAPAQVRAGSRRRGSMAAALWPSSIGPEARRRRPPSPDLCAAAGQSKGPDGGPCGVWGRRRGSHDAVVRRLGSCSSGSGGGPEGSADEEQQRQAGVLGNGGTARVEARWGRAGVADARYSA